MESSTKKRERRKRKRRNVLDGRKRVERTRGGQRDKDEDTKRDEDTYGEKEERVLLVGAVSGI